MTGKRFAVFSSAVLLMSIAVSLALGIVAARTQTHVTYREVSSLRSMAEKNLSLNKLDLAQEVSEKALFFRPTDPLVHTILGRVYKKKFEGDKGQGFIFLAMAHHKIALAMEPSLADISYNLACYYANVSEVESAFTWLAQAFTNGFGRDNLLGEDSDLTILRNDARFIALETHGLFPDLKPEAQALLSQAEVTPGKSVELTIFVEQWVENDQDSTAWDPKIEWKSDLPIRVLGKSESTHRESKDPWVKIRTEARYELMVEQEGLFIISPARVTLADEVILHTAALVLQVRMEPAGGRGGSEPPEQAGNH